MLGSLTIVGTGIQFPNQMTLESIDVIKNAERVFFNVGEEQDVIAWIKANNAHTFDLADLYGSGKDRRLSYAEMCAAMVTAVKEGYRTVGVLYGHPGVFALPGYLAINQCRELGAEAKMLPGVSAFDCMIADLEFDPGTHGCTMLEASDYVFHRRTLDTSLPLIIWQPALIGVDSILKGVQTAVQPRLDILKARLLEDYPATHKIISYVAATEPGKSARVEMTQIGSMETMRSLASSSTCLIPPLKDALTDMEYFSRLKK